MDTHDVIVIGGGLAGLTAAATAARRGRDVAVLEARSFEGGRAHTVERDGYRFNEGAHALYVGGPGIQILRELGVDPRGQKPPQSGWGVRHGRLKRFPASPLDSMRTTLVSTRAKAQLGRTLMRPRRALGTDLDGRSMQQWIDERFASDDARDLVAITAAGGDLLRRSRRDRRQRRGAPARRRARVGRALPRRRLAAAGRRTARRVDRGRRHDPP